MYHRQWGSCSSVMCKFQCFFLHFLLSHQYLFPLSLRSNVPLRMRQTLCLLSQGMFVEILPHLIRHKVTRGVQLVQVPDVHRPPLPVPHHKHAQICVRIGRIAGDDLPDEGVDSLRTCRTGHCGRKGVSSHEITGTIPQQGSDPGEKNAEKCGKMRSRSLGLRKIAGLS